MRRIALVCAPLVALVVSACGSPRAHTVCTGGVDGALVGQAALFELDDYGTTNHCAGADVADAAIAPATRGSYVAGGGISISLPPGRHTLVLRAFSDSGGTTPIGSGCVELELAAGGDFCID